tara:strand:- start:12299 stop:12580 length:282 start_codon:yes stop_codon:yes gene_type:complete
MINRYQCFTGFQATNYDAERRNDGPWVYYKDHAKEIADLRALAREAVKEAYAEAFDDAWNLERGEDAETLLIQLCWLESGAACDFKREERDDG